VTYGRGSRTQPRIDTHGWEPGKYSNLGRAKILEHVDEVADIQEITYDRKRKSIMKRTTKKRRLTLDSSILITIEEKCLTQNTPRHPNL
jgi:DNA-directed RNA polymerase subunit E'/Rpb7